MNSNFIIFIKHIKEKSIGQHNSTLTHTMEVSLVEILIKVCMITNVRCVHLTDFTGSRRKQKLNCASLWGGGGRHLIILTLCHSGI